MGPSQGKQVENADGPNKDKGISGGFCFPVTLWPSNWQEKFKCKHLGQEANGAYGSQRTWSLISAIIKLIKILCILPQIVPSEPGWRVELVWVLPGRQETNGSQHWLHMTISQGLSTSQCAGLVILPVKPHSAGGSARGGDYSVWSKCKNLGLGEDHKALCVLRRWRWRWEHIPWHALEGDQLSRDGDAWPVEGIRATR